MYVKIFCTARKWRGPNNKFRLRIQSLFIPLNQRWARRRADDIYGVRQLCDSSIRISIL
jgi:hypothetical protein